MTTGNTDEAQTPYPQPLVPDVLWEGRMTPESLAIPMSEIMKASGRDERTTLDDLLAEIAETQRAGDELARTGRRKGARAKGALGAQTAPASAA